MRPAPRSAALVAALLTTLACGRDLTGIGAQKPSGLRVTTDSAALYRDQTFRFDVVYETPEQTRSVLGDPLLEVSAEPANRLQVDRDGNGKALSAGTATLRAVYQGFVAEVVLEVRPGTLQSLSVAPSPAVVAVGATTQLTVTGNLDDGTTLDLTKGRTGTSYTLREPLAGVSADGLITGITAGSTQIAVRNGAINTNVELNVTTTGDELVALLLVPERLDLEFGESTSLVARGRRASGAEEVIVPGPELSFASADPRLASVDGLGQVVAGRTTGTTVITAKFRGLSGNASVAIRPPASELVGLDVQPVFSTLGIGERRQLQVTGFYRDGSTANLSNRSTGTTYASSDARVARVSGNGVVVARELGRAQIDVQNSGFVISAFVEVIPARTLVRLEISPQPISVGVGGTAQVTVFAFYDDGSVDDVTRGVGTSYGVTPRDLANASPDGLIFGLREGQGTLRATFEGVTATAPIQVGGGQLAFITLIAPRSLLVGERAPVQVLATFTDGRQVDVTFDPALSLTATAPQLVQLFAGTVVGIQPGSLSIQAFYLGFFAEAPLVVIDPNDPVVGVFFSPPALSLSPGQVSSTQVLAQLASGNVVDVSNDPNLSLGVSGEVLVLNQNNGVTIQALNPGTGTIFADYFGFQAIFTLTVAPSGSEQLILIAPSQMVVGQADSFLVFLLDSQGNVTEVTNAPNLVVQAIGPITVMNGVINAIGPGTATLVVTLGGLSASKTIVITVQPDPILSIEFRPTQLNLAVGDSALVRLIGRTAQGSIIDITFDQNTQYSFSGPINPFPEVGAIRIDALGPGQGLVDATFQGGPVPLSTQLLVNIGQTTLIGLRLIVPPQVDLTGGDVPYTVLAEFSDGSVQDVTFDLSTFVQSSDPNVLLALPPVLVPISAGFAVITAQFQGLLTSERVEVVIGQPPIIFSVNPSVLQLGGGDTVVFIDGANFTPGSEVLISGFSVPVVVLGSSILQAVIPAQLLTTSGPLTLEVNTPAGLSNAVELQVTTAPRVTSYSPTALIAGSSIQVTAVGEGLRLLNIVAPPGMTVSNVVERLDGLVLSFTLRAALNGPIGPFPVELINPLGSATLTFDVQPATGQPDLVVAAGQTLTLSGTNVFGNVTINTGGRVVGNGDAALAIIATGDIVVRGIIEVNGRNGQNGLNDPRRGGDGGPGGGGGGGGADGNAPTPANGGDGSPPGSPASPGQGPGTPAGNGGGDGGGLGSPFGCGTGGGGGGFFGAGGFGGGDGGPGSGAPGGAAGSSGSLFGGGTGGGGGGTCGNGSGGGGGGGGGVLILQVPNGGSITIDGSLRANGGNGGDGFGGTGGAGGGSGGRIQVLAPNGTIVVNDTISASGGRGGDGDFNESGGGGGGGLIELDATGGSVTAALGLLDVPGGAPGVVNGMGSAGTAGGVGQVIINQ